VRQERVVVRSFMGVCERGLSKIRVVRVAIERFAAHPPDDVAEQEEV